MSRRWEPGGALRRRGGEGRRRRVSPGSAIAALALVLTACTSPGIPRPEMRALYEAAIRDAMEAEPSEVRDDLVRLVPGEEGLEWRSGRVLVAAWSRDRSLWRRAGERVTLGEEARVSAGRGVQERCRDIHTGSRELRLRLEQLLGLPLGGGRGRRFVEMWVAPADLFRPCLDPDPTRSGCGLQAPPEGVPEEHRTWLEARARRAHRPGGDPWTGLGYFYDWGSPFTEVGPVELVVRRGAEVEIERVAGTEEYCRRVRRR